MTHMPDGYHFNAMQVNNIYKETDEVYTLELYCPDIYSYRPGQYAFVKINGSETILRAYTLSSSPGVSPFIALTIRRIENGIGSNWLTQQVKKGDTLWLSNVQGNFTSDRLMTNRCLMLAAGCGITPIMSMTRWLLINKPDAHITVIYHVKISKDIIFATEWQNLAKTYRSQLNLIIVTTQEKQDSMPFGRLSAEQLRHLVPDFENCTVMTCGPLEYMDRVQQTCDTLDIDSELFHKEQFHAVSESQMQIPSSSFADITLKHLNKQFSVPVGTTLLYALEQQQVPVIAACRTGICGSCKTKVISGRYTTTSKETLTDDEITAGYVLACSCQIESDLIIG